MNGRLDYLDSVCWYGPSKELPSTFAGISGGPVWGIKLIKDEQTGKFRLLKSALIGITFYQTDVKNMERRLRAHFIRSIYDLAWKI